MLAFILKQFESTFCSNFFLQFFFLINLHFMFVGEAKPLDAVLRGDLERGQQSSFRQSEKKTKSKKVECRA